MSKSRNYTRQNFDDWDPSEQESIESFSRKKKQFNTLHEQRGKRIIHNDDYEKPNPSKRLSGNHH